jgi:large subunit ribosomal protein L2
MGIKRYKPTSAGRRQASVSDFADITRSHPEKSLTVGVHKKGGRNSNGRTTAWQRGGGHARRYRLIDFQRDKPGVPAKVRSIEYDPNRSARIALLVYADGEKRYVIAPAGLQVGDQVVSGSGVDIVTGNAARLRDLPTGTQVHALELTPGKGAQVARAAGTVATLMAKEGEYGLVRMPSGEVRKIHLECKATVGAVGNAEHENVSWGKAGRRRWLGIRPSVRGVAMNPVDHPMGGGEGKTSGGRHPTTPWGKPTKGYKTRKNKRTSAFIVRRRGTK